MAKELDHYQKNRLGQQPGQQPPGQGQADRNKQQRDRLQKAPGGHGERSDKEAIDRPVQLDKEPGKPLPSSEGGREHEPAGA